MSDLPDGWEWTTLGELGTWLGGGTPSKNNSSFWENGTVPWVSPKDMGVANVVSAIDSITLKAVRETSVKLVPAGAVIMVVRSGVLVRRFPVAVLRVEATLNQDMKALVPARGVDSSWVMFVLRALESEVLTSCRKAGTTVASIDSGSLDRLPIPLPPLAEQRRIVAALEGHLSRVGSSRHDLGRASEKLLRLPSSLIDQGLSDVASAPVQPLYRLLSEPMRNGHSAPASGGREGVRTLTLTAVTKNCFIDSYTKVTTADPAKVSDLWLRSGDILVQRSNTPDLVGTSAIYKGPDEWAIFPDLLIRLRLKKELLPEYVQLVLSSRSIHGWLKRNAKGLSGSMPKIDQSTLGSVSIPVPSMAAQRSFVESVRRRVDATQHLVDQVELAQIRAEGLRRSLLREAFAGRLVEQDAGDEPASVLLERIRVERESAPKARRGRKPRAAKGKSADGAVATIDPARPLPETVGKGTQDTLDLGL
ncbi:restriction endonuclease subunit S [Saccharopolyspora gregorii]|uniref:restriction endonuclease subunit S n=1 Tax=Saccharopolyspora gregorii TaxID=33914 RepID=UPI0031EFE2D6